MRWGGNRQGNLQGRPVFLRTRSKIGPPGRIGEGREDGFLEEEFKTRNGRLTLEGESPYHTGPRKILPGALRRSSLMRLNA